MRIPRFVAVSTLFIVPTWVLAADVLVPARVQVLKPGTKSLIVGKPPAKDATFPLPASDPRKTGASILWCGLGGEGECQTFNLPQGGWKGIGAGYKYTGAGTPSDPCKSVLIKKKVIRASCKVSGLSIPVGDAGVSWQMSVGVDRYCAESSSTTSAIVKTNDERTWRAIRADAPASCHAFCGDGIVDPGEACDPGLNEVYEGFDSPNEFYYFWSLCRDNCQFAPETCSDEGMLCAIKPFGGAEPFQIDCCEGFECDEAHSGLEYYHRCRPACATQADCAGTPGTKCEGGACSAFRSCTSDADCNPPFTVCPSPGRCECGLGYEFLCS